MSEEICYRDQDRLDYIFEQVKALSNVVDELRREVKDLKKISLNAKRDDMLFECTKLNCEIDHVRPCVVGNVKTYFKNVKDFTATEEICQFTENSQVSKSDSPNYMVQSKRDEELPSYKSLPAKITLSTIYDGLKSFKNKLIKIIHNVPTPQLFLKSTKNNYAESSEQRRIRLSRKEEERKLCEFDKANENDIFKCIDIHEEPDDSTDTSLVSDASTQTDITICSYQKDDKKSAHSSCWNVTRNNVQASPSSLITDNRLIIHSNWATNESSKGRVKRAFLKNKFKKYKICSCGSQCPYTLYKLPCCDQNKVLEEKIDDEVGGLTLECSSFEEKNNFPKFVNIDSKQKEYNECFADFGANGSSTSSLSVDLEMDICGDHGKPEKDVIDEFSKRKTMTHIMRGTSANRNDNAISYFKAKNKPPMYVNLEANQQAYRTRTEDFTRDYPPIKSNEQVHYSSATLKTVRRMPIRTSTPDFRRSDSANRSCRATDMIKRINFFKLITPKRMKMNMHTQTERRSYLNYLQSIDLPIVLDANERDMEMIDEDEIKRILQKKNTCDICDLPRPKTWSRNKEYKFVLREEEDGEANLNKSGNQIGYFNYQRDRMAPLRTF